MQSQAKNVDAYLREAPEDRRQALAQLRELCVEILEGYAESMEYGMPGYKKGDGEIEVGFASQKNYISLYILKQDVFEAHRERFAGLSLGKGCIRFKKPEQIDFNHVHEILTASFMSDSEIC